jgi:hypothetical protein
MNTPMPALPISLRTADVYKRKRILLVDPSPRKRDLRADVLRKMEVDVDCAADIGEARCWWRADFYDLVLIAVDKGPGHRDKFCDDVRGATPPQRLAFLVGEPEYLAASPRDDQQAPTIDDQLLLSNVNAVLSSDLKNVNQRWGIMEASRKISAVRSAYTARTRAIRDRIDPPRDTEARSTKRIPASPTLDDLLREGMQ